MHFCGSAFCVSMLSHDQFFVTPKDCSLPGSSVHGILQARLEWVAISHFSRSSWPRDRTWVSCTGRQISYHWATGEGSAFCNGIQCYRDVPSKSGWKTKQLSKWTQKLWHNLLRTLRNNVTTLLFKFILLLHQLPLIRSIERQEDMQTHTCK